MAEKVEYHCSRSRCGKEMYIVEYLESMSLLDKTFNELSADLFCPEPRTNTSPFMCDAYKCE